MQSCDADAKGSEVAQYEVYLPKGKLLLCDHHMQSSWPAMQETGGIVALRIGAVDNEAFDILSSKSDASNALDFMQKVMLESRPEYNNEHPCYCGEYVIYSHEPFCTGQG